MDIAVETIGGTSGQNAELEQFRTNITYKAFDSLSYEKIWDRMI